ncbi:MAG TPA: FtsQ-type POTRA domain-containing protein [Thermodesulfovibrionales bacterium]|nr:FtsQ-type POTRA domain-containing protein [Thermodesulfovibrionales bacterium]
MKAIHRKNGRTAPTRRSWVRRHYRALLVLFLLGSAGVVLGVGLYRVSSGIFAVKEVVFSGNRHMSDAELRAAAGVKKGDNLLMVSPRRVSERLLESPWIRTVSIRKELPERLLIRVSEATPFAILDRKGHSFLIDEKGRMLEKIQGDGVPFLPIINGDPAKMRETFVEALRLAGVLKEKKIATERNRVEILANGKGPEELAVVIDSVIIKVGSGDYEQKIERFFSLEDEIKKRAITVDYVDLRFASRVVVKPVNEVVR